MTVAVELTHLTYSYPDGTKALEDISFSIGEGERVAIIGANGAGKSTLLLHLNGIIEAGSAVQVFGLSAEKKNLKEIRRSAGLVFQNPDDQLFSPTLYDDVAFGPRNYSIDENKIEKIVDEALDSVGLNGERSKPPFHLSIGQKKRGAIASVLALSPKILLLDEPSTSLDPKGKREISTLLKEREGTQIIVTHDLDLAFNLTTRTILLSNGKKVADGITSEIVKNLELLKKHSLY